MRERGRDDASNMQPSPLARLIRTKQAEGLTMREMQIRAHMAGYRLTDTAISQIALDQRRGRLRPGTIEALAAALDESAETIARLDDERWHIAHDPAEDPFDRIIREIADGPFTRDQKRMLIAQVEAAKQERDEREAAARAEPGRKGRKHA